MHNYAISRPRLARHTYAISRPRLATRAARAGATRVPPAHPSRPGMRHAARTHARTCRCGVPQVVWAKELTNTLKACTLIAAQLGKPGADPAESDRLMVAAAASGGEGGGAAQRAQRDERPWLSGGAKKKKKAVVGREHEGEGVVLACCALRSRALA